MENKNYSHWLVVSDIDGTLNNKLRRTPKVNIRAIDRFVNELGGNFTLASARCVESLAPHYKRLPGLKTPAIVLNGAGIYDFTSEKMLWFNPIPIKAQKVVSSALEKFPLLEIGIFTDESIYLVRPRILGPGMMWLDSLTHTRCSKLSQVPEGKWGKVIFFCMPKAKAEVKEYVRSLTGSEVTLTDTTSASFDMLSSTAQKGEAVSVLAGILGIADENIGAIGDYYNDLEMLGRVAHPACCSQAPEELHRVCEYITCHCNKGAVADFLSYIENKY